MSQTDDLDQTETISLLLDLMLRAMNAGSIDYCCLPVGEEACGLVLGHDGACNPDPDGADDA